jgi:hypothetical protein
MIRGYHEGQLEAAMEEQEWGERLKVKIRVEFLHSVGFFSSLLCVGDGFEPWTSLLTLTWSPRFVTTLPCQCTVGGHCPSN